MLELASPDGQLVLTLSIVDDGTRRDINRRCPAWRVSYRGRPMLLDSRLGLTLDGLPSLTTYFEIADAQHETIDETWRPVCGERAQVRDHCNEMSVLLRETIEPRRTMTLIFRAYDTGVAMRYVLDRQPGLEQVDIWREETRFRFPPGCHGWDTKLAQSTYERRAIGEIGDKCERPLLIEYPGGQWAAVGEAAQDDYPRMKLRTDSRRADTLAADLDGNPRQVTPFATPWRYVIVGDRAADIPQRNDLVLNLCPPSRISDTTWIRPGKAVREMTLSTEGGKRCVDFAVERNLQYILYDGGWYGHPLDEATQADSVDLWQTKITDPETHGGLDLAEVIRYAKSRGVGVWLYVDQHALERQLDRLLPLYRQWGVAGIKFGFVHEGPQGWTRWLIDAVRKCADHQLMVDIHDEYRPTGLQRTWPNLVNVEGILGNEAFPSAALNVTLPYTRFVAGMADYTICCYDRRLTTRRTHQLAMAVCYFGPFQMLYWYDRPEQYAGEPELAFFDAVPTVWDETHVLDGYPGRFVVTARRSGDAWFLGAMSGDEAVEVEVPLRFLGGAYDATIYRDGGAGQNDVAVERRRVDAGAVLPLAMRPAGGCAVLFTPAH